MSRWPILLPQSHAAQFLRRQAISATIFHLNTLAPRRLNRPGDKRWASETVGGKGSRRLAPGGSPSCCGTTPMPPRRPSSGTMLQIKIRWGDLGSPVEPGTYRCGPHIVEVMPGDINLAKGNPDAVFTAIHPNFYPDAAPYLLTGVDFTPTNPEVERCGGDRLPIGPEQALAESSDQASAVEKPRSSGQTSLKERPSTARTPNIIGEFNRIWDDPRPDSPADTPEPPPTPLVK